MSERRAALELALQDALGYRFQDSALIGRAVNHRSARGPSNERLEFLGDAVLDTVISLELFNQFGQADEGVLSRLRASLVRDDSLAEIAAELALGGLLKLGPGELKSGGARRQSLLADALEALFAAVFLDGGYDAAEQVILRVFRERLSTLELTAAKKDAKTRLQEFLQSRNLALPEYALDRTEGPPHQQQFFVTCAIGEPVTSAQGSGGSRRLAEQRAAESVLQQIDPKGTS